jgi:hypothetical protein
MNATSIELRKEELVVGKREISNGGVLIRTVVQTENVSQPVELRREEKGQLTVLPQFERFRPHHSTPPRPSPSVLPAPRSLPTSDLFAPLSRGPVVRCPVVRAHQRAAYRLDRGAWQHQSERHMNRSLPNAGRPHNTNSRYR